MLDLPPEWVRHTHQTHYLDPRLSLCSFKPLADNYGLTSDPTLVTCPHCILHRKIYFKDFTEPAHRYAMWFADPPDVRA